MLLVFCACDGLDFDDERNDQLSCIVPLNEVRSTALDFPYTQGEKQPDLINPSLLSSLTDDFFIDPNTRIVGFILDNIPIAIPLSTMHFHLIANIDAVDDSERVTVSYSRFTESVRVFKRSEAAFRSADEIWGRSNVIFDQIPDNSLWSHFLGKAICGPKSEEYIESHPSYVMAFQEWAALHPSTEVYLQADFLPYSLDYEQIKQVERATYPNNDDDSVMAFIGEDDAASLDLSAFPSGMYLSSTSDFGNRQIIIFGVAGAGIANAFYSDLEFEINDFNFTDTATGSTWDLMGRATSGPELGTALEPVPEAFQTNKGSWNSFFPSKQLP